MKRPSLKLPEIKMPRLGRGGGGESSSGANPAGGDGSSRLPEPVRAVWQDLRDRNLAPVAVLIAVAIVAVPVLMSSSPASEPPPPAPAAADADVSQLEAAVMVEEAVGVRDYSERLEQLRERNPFRQRFVAPPAGGSGDGGEGAGGGDPGRDLPRVEPLPEPDPVDVAPSFPDLPDGGLGGGGRGGSAPSDTGREPAPQPEPERIVVRPDPKLLIHEITVRAGRKGDSERIEDVRSLSFLPSPRTPVALFLGAAPNGKRALMLVSSEVRSSRGDGECQPRGECRFLTMRAGDRRQFVYEPDGRVYTLKLFGITRRAIG